MNRLRARVREIVGGIGSLRHGVYKERSVDAKMPIKRKQGTSCTAVDAYWGKHLVRSKSFKSAKESLEYLEWRFEQYPLFREFMQLYGNHSRETIVDYGCGPGNDLVGFLVKGNAGKVIGIDISEKAVSLARETLALHQVESARVELILTSDSNPDIPLDDKSVDYIYCEGVLHHTTSPESILTEFNRILKSHGSGRLMVYNRNSIWFHLYTAYEKMIRQNAFDEEDVETAFGKSTDGEECPIARCYIPEEFMEICSGAGFQTEYIGGYLSLHELRILKELENDALRDEMLADEHKEFLRNLVYDRQGYPKYKGKHAGIGGVYRLHKA
jgi:ubiquinone/menaquinone biosynthesis C-methylase UbiE